MCRAARAAARAQGVLPRMIDYSSRDTRTGVVHAFADGVTGAGACRDMARANLFRSLVRRAVR